MYSSGQISDMPVCGIRAKAITSTAPIAPRAGRNAGRAR